MNAKCAPRREVTRGVITPVQIVGLSVRALSESAEGGGCPGRQFYKTVFERQGDCHGTSHHRPKTKHRVSKRVTIWPICNRNLSLTFASLLAFRKWSLVNFLIPIP